MPVSPYVLNEDDHPANRAELQAAKASRFLLISLMVATVLLFPAEAVWKLFLQ